MNPDFHHAVARGASFRGYKTPGLFPPRERGGFGGISPRPNIIRRENGGVPKHA